MKITPLGTGSAFAMKNYQTMYMLENNGHCLLIDCGGDARFAIEASEYTIKDIESVYISHMHSDHIGGLEWLGFYTYFVPGLKTPTLYISASLKDTLWSNALSAGMGSLQGEVVGLEDYFNIKSLKENASFKWNKLTLTPVQTIHVMNGYNIVPSFGLLIDSGKTVIFVTTDTQYAPSQIDTFYDKADVIFHDCETMEDENQNPIKSKVHAHYSELIDLPGETKSKMLFTHYNDNWEDLILRAHDDGFKGFAIQGETYEYL